MNTPLHSTLRIKLVIVLVAMILGGTFMPKGFAEDAKPAPTPEQEAKLVSTFANATLKGRWAPIKDGQLGPEKEDTYEIVSAKKLEGDHWQINARFQYGGRAIDLPIPAIVKWAGDAVVLVFDGISIGTPRMYSARLMIHENAYSGTWSGGDHGGMLYGLISHAAN